MDIKTRPVLTNMEKVLIDTCIDTPDIKNPTYFNSELYNSIGRSYNTVYTRTMPNKLAAKNPLLGHAIVFTIAELKNLPDLLPAELSCRHNQHILTTLSYIID